MCDEVKGSPPVAAARRLPTARSGVAAAIALVASSRAHASADIGVGYVLMGVMVDDERQ